MAGKWKASEKSGGVDPQLRPLAGDEPSRFGKAEAAVGVTFPDEQVAEKDLLARLDEALNYLPDKERELLKLAYFEHYSVREAGRTLGWQKVSRRPPSHGSATESTCL